VIMYLGLTVWYLVQRVSMLMIQESTFIVFFFQAEDGIRDKLVTGVLTCALPISRTQKELQMTDTAEPYVDAGHAVDQVSLSFVGSEERRVGKECRSGWSPYYESINHRRILSIKVPSSASIIT